jgi:hypothetical protein
MRAGRSLLSECCAVLRCRRARVKLRAMALLGCGIGLTLGAALQMLVGPCDGAMIGALFVLMLWGAFIACVGTWRLL